jgi:hypothetical protein
MWISLFTAATGLAITFALGSVLLELLDERPRRKRRRAANRSYR